MYASGTWRGFWEQKHHGRQEMRAFELHFRAGKVTGSGVDLVGPFTMRGGYDAAGRVLMVKQYVGRHQVVYRGEPDGEGSLFGVWRIPGVGDYSGPFLMRPELAPPGGGAIVTIRPRPLDAN